MVPVALLLLGAAANVAVAWACAAWSEPRYDFFGSNAASTVGVGVTWSLVSDPGDERAIEVLSGWPWPSLAAQQVQRMQGSVVSGGMPLKGKVMAPAAGAPMNPWFFAAPGLVPGPAVAVGTAPAGDALRVLPLGPRWPGFVLGALLYGCLLWVLVRWPLVLRAILRRAVWRCPVCAYPMGVGPVCTECGSRLVPSGRLAFLLGALAIGAAVNLAVAWGCALGSPDMPAASQAAPRQAPSRADARWWRATAPPDVSPRPPSGREVLALGPGKVCTRMWQWPFAPPGAAMRVRAGWPMQSMELSRWLADVGKGGRVDVRDWLMLPSILSRTPDAVVPLRPVLWGTLVNTLFYAVIVFLMGAGVRWLAVRRYAAGPRRAQPRPGVATAPPALPESGAARTIPA